MGPCAVTAAVALLLLASCPAAVAAGQHAAAAAAAASNPGAVSPHHGSPSATQITTSWHSAANYDVTYDCPGSYCSGDREVCHCKRMLPANDEAACRAYCQAGGCFAYAFQITSRQYPNGTSWWRTDNFFNMSFTWGNATSCPPPTTKPCNPSGDVSGCRARDQPAACWTHPPHTQLTRSEVLTRRDSTASAAANR
jgi:hypothetical protein